MKMCVGEAPHISIITICKNSSTTLRRTIDSVLLQQWYGKLEYIIVDGGSTDDTMDIVRSHGDKISKSISEPDNGISDAFNKGIAMADGGLVGIINSDDFYVPGTFAKVQKYFEEYPDVEVLHADLMLYDGERFIKMLKPPRYWWIPWRMILFNHPTTFVRRHVYEKIGNFNLTYRYSMDFELFLRWMKAGITIGYIPEVLVNMQAGGVSGRNIYLGFSENLRALKAHGYNLPLAFLQYISKHVAQRILNIFSRIDCFNCKIS
jgi:glycosyltransferase involved in cell wall biosynthesis